MSGSSTDPKDVHVDIRMPSWLQLPAGSFVRVVLSNDGVNPEFTVSALLNGAHLDAYVLDDTAHCDKCGDEADGTQSGSPCGRDLSEELGQSPSTTICDGWYE